MGAREGAVWPFSIFDSIATESPAACATSEAVMLSDWRNAFTCAPSASIRWRSTRSARGVSPAGRVAGSGRFALVRVLLFVRKEGRRQQGLQACIRLFARETQGFSAADAALRGRAIPSCARA